MHYGALYLSEQFDESKQCVLSGHCDKKDRLILVDNSAKYVLSLLTAARFRAIPCWTFALKYSMSLHI